MSTAAAVPPPPRRVPSEAVKGVADLVLVLVGGMFFLFGSILSAVFLNTLPIDLALDFGAPQTATVTIERFDVDTTVTVNDQHPIEMRYVFEANGAVIRGRSQTFNYDWVDAFEASPDLSAEVEFVADRPQWSRLKGTKRTPGAYWICFILIFPGIGAALLAGGIIPRLRRRALYRSGDAMLAQVEDVGLNHNITVNGRNPTRIRWSFSVQGQRFEGSWSGFNHTRFYNGEPQVPIIYDPKNPKRSILFIG
jgi:hypothetical protein